MKYFSSNLVMSNSRGVSLIALAVVATVLTGCGADKAKATQVAAKINSEEITISQVNNALASVPVTPGKTAEEAKQEVLNNLIIQNLAEQQAVKMKLDRKPEVMQAIENAKNTILARAYMDPIMLAVPKPSADDAHKFYVGHPELFSDRHIFSLKELEVETKPELAESIREMAGKGESLDAIAASLKAKNITSSIHEGVKPAEQLPLEMLQQLSKLPAGKLMVIELSKTISVLQVVSAKVEPVKEAQATAIINEYLINNGKKEVLDKEVKALKAGAKIEYFGEFKTDAASTVAAEAKQAAAEVAAKKAAKSDTPDLAKGIAGLK